MPSVVFLLVVLVILTVALVVDLLWEWVKGKE